MAAFNYTAVNAEGKSIKGVLEADGERQVREKLRQQHLTPIKIQLVQREKQTAKKSLFTKGKISYKELALITRQMATLLSAGLPLDEVLTGVAEQAQQQKVKSVLLGVRAKVLEGHSLATAMAEFPHVFPALYQTTVAAGEKSGRLDTVLLKLADYTEKQHRLKQKVQQALIYPIMMTVVAIAIVIFLMIYVVPKIVAVFIQTKQVLPLSTIVLIHISQFIHYYGIYALLFLILLFYAFRRALKKPDFQKRFYNMLLKMPVIGKVVRSVNTARFARTFGILHAATVPVLASMQTAASLIVPLGMREAVLYAVDKVREGSSIHRALRQSHYFPPILLHLIESGEASGQLDDMLLKAAADQETEMESIIQTVLTLFEPILIIVMGGVVLYIVLAIMLPIFSLDTFTG